ncbi:MAG TPA: glycosyltransferase [Candidatus Thermoplasmatota archaeon]|nr:glycosyltransferase [Candidatus Thermoplasmatota archaeon]
MAAGRVSVVLTTQNEEKNLRHLLDSLAAQRGLHEVILVDSASTDRTVEVAEGHRNLLPRLQVVVRRCSRGEGRNLGAALASGDLLAFIDGDCVANAFWTERLLETWDGEPDRVVAGRTQLTGYWAFTKLHRVELPHRGQDTTWPSCNLAYPRSLFARLGGFDPAFVTAEDIDLNVRAVNAGAHIVHAPEAIVYARARDSIRGFLRQAYWNGYGRKQLTRKHGSLWRQYRLRDLVRLQGGSAWGLLRMAAGFVGYLSAKFGRRPPA